MTEGINIRAGWLIDGTGSPALKDPLIQIREGLIRWVGPAEARPPGEKERAVIDLPGRTLIPALVDAHLHLFMSPAPDPGLRQAQLRAVYDDLAPTMAAHACGLREYGVLAVRDGGDYGGFSLRFRDQEVGRYPLVRSPGRAWRKLGRYGRLIGRPPVTGLAQEIREQAPGIDHVKLVGSGLNSLTQFGRQTAPQFSQKELRAGVEAAHAQGLKAMIHANGEEPVRLAVEAGCDSIEHGFFMGRENLERMAEAGCVWVPTAVTMAGYAQTLEPGDPGREIAARTLEGQLALIALGRRLEVRMACGSDSGSLGVVHGESLGREIALLMEAGLSLERALAAATSQGAELLGLGQTMGRIAPGWEGTFLAFKGGPAELAKGLGKPEAVFVRGRRVEDWEEAGLGPGG